MDETRGLQGPDSKPIPPTTPQISELAKEHWVEIALGVGAVAALVIGILAQTDVIHQVGSLSSDAIMSISYTAAGTGTFFLVRSALSSYLTWKIDKAQAAAHIQRQKMPPASEKNMHVEWYKTRNSEAKSKIEAEVVSKKGEIDSMKWYAIAQEAEKKTPEEARAYIKEKLNEIPLPQYGCLLFKVGDQYILKGKAINFTQQKSLFFDGTEKLAEFSQTDLEANSFLFLGTQRSIDALQEKEINADILKILREQKKTEVIEYLITSKLTEKGFLPNEYDIFKPDRF